MITHLKVYLQVQTSVHSQAVHFCKGTKEKPKNGEQQVYIDLYYTYMNTSDALGVTERV